MSRHWSRHVSWYYHREGGIELTVGSRDEVAVDGPGLLSEVLVALPDLQ